MLHGAKSNANVRKSNRRKSKRRATRAVAQLVKRAPTSITWMQSNGSGPLVQLCMPTCFLRAFCAYPWPPCAGVVRVKVRVRVQDQLVGRGIHVRVQVRIRVRVRVRV